MYDSVCASVCASLYVCVCVRLAFLALHAGQGAACDPARLWPLFSLQAKDVGCDNSSSYTDTHMHTDTRIHTHMHHVS